MPGSCGQTIFCDSTSCSYINLYNYLDSCFLTCPLGTFPNNLNYTCPLCDVGCGNCSNLTSCLQCVSGEFLYLGTCVLACPSGTYPVNGEECLNCDPSCLTCSSANLCTSCNIGFYLFGNNCQSACPSGYYPNSSTNLCTLCDVGCNLCSGIQQCTQCTLPLYLYQGSCLSSCPTGTYGDNLYNCLSCPLSCKTCSSQTICLSCQNNFFISGVNCLTICPIGFYGDSTTWECLICDFSCQTCNGSLPNNCLSCNGQVGLYIYSGSCISTCPAGTFNDSLSSSCALCDSTCLTCDNYGSKACLTCNLGSYLNSTSCMNPCPLSYFGDDLSQTCLNCALGCLSCNGINNCSMCDSSVPYYLTNGLCVQNCPLATYKDKMSYQCSSCGAYCEKCDDSEICLICQSNYFLYNFECIADCPSGFFNDNSSGICSPCDSTCVTCSGVSSLECLSCNISTGFYLILGSCISQCQAGYYIDNITSNCSSCDNSCTTCMGPTNNNCLSCGNSTYLHNLTCVNACPLGTYANQITGVCITCDVSCKTCSKGTENDCLSCNNLMILSQKNSCLNLSPEGSGEDAVANENQTMIFANMNEINNPYSFLLIFYWNNSHFIDGDNFQNLMRNLSVNISTLGPNDYDFSIQNSTLNDSSFQILITYTNSVQLNDNSMINFAISSINNYASTIVFQNQTFNFKLKPNRLCQSGQYFDSNTLQCQDQLLITYDWSYTTTPSLITIQFSALNPSIIQALNTGTLLLFNVPTKQLNIDYTLSVSLNENLALLSLTINNNVSFVSGVLLDVTANHSYFNFLNNNNDDFYLQESNFTIKLLEIYILSSQTQNVIKQTGSASNVGSWMATISLILGLFNKPGSSFALRGLTLANLIQMLKYIHLNYPPNVISIFKPKSSGILISQDIITCKNSDNEKIPDNLKYFKISACCLDNTDEDIFQILLLTSICHLFRLLNYLLRKKITHELLKKILKNFEKFLIWNLLISIVSTKYLSLSFFSFLALRVGSKSPLNFLSAFFLFLFIIFFPIHLFFMIKIIWEKDVLKGINSAEKDKSNKVAPFEQNKNSILSCVTSAGNSNKVLPLSMQFSLQKKPIPWHSFNRNIGEIEKTLERELKLIPQPTFNSQKKIDIYGFPILESEKKVLSQKEIIIEKNELVTYPESDRMMQNQVVSVENENTMDMATTSNTFNMKNDLKLEIAPISKQKIKRVWDNTPLYSPGKIPIGKKKNIASTSNFISKLCSFLSSIFLCPFKSLNKIYVKRNLIFDHHKILFGELKVKPGLHKFRFFFDLLRLGTISFLTAVPLGYPMIQIALFNIINGCFFLFMVISRPFSSRINNFWNFFNETCVNFSFVASFFICLMNELDDQNVDRRMNLGWIVVFANLTLLFSIVIMSINKIRKNVNWQKLKCKKKNKVFSGDN